MDTNEITFDELSYSDLRDEALKTMKKESMFKAGVGGILGAVIGATIFVLFGYLSGQQFGITALIIGFIVGFLVKLFGKGSDIRFGLIGALFALVSCLLGHYGLLYMNLMDQTGNSAFEVIKNVDHIKIMVYLFKNISLMDVVFIVLAVYESFKISLSNEMKNELDHIDGFRIA